MRGSKAVVTERVDATGRLVHWSIRPAVGPVIIRFAVAVKSPLTGAWLVHDACCESGTSYRVPTLKRARSSVLGGNGKQRGRHTEVGRVGELSWSAFTLTRVAT